MQLREKLKTSWKNAVRKLGYVDIRPPYPKNCTNKKLRQWLTDFIDNGKLLEEQDALVILENFEKESSQYSCKIPWLSFFRACAAYDNKELLKRAAQKTMEQFPAHLKIWEVIGKRYWDLNHLVEAEEVLKKIVDLQPDNVETWELLGSVHFELKKLTAAEDAYRQAITLQPTNFLIHLLLSKVLEKQQRFEECLRAINKAIEIAPQNYLSWAALGRFQYDRSNFEIARDAYQEAIRLKPDKAGLHNSLGLAHFRRAEFQEAEKAFLCSKELDVGDYIAWENVATARIELHDFKGAWEAKSEAERYKLSNIYVLIAAIMKNDNAGKNDTPILISATIDLKLTPDGKVQICEFNNLWPSGFAGFQRLTGLNMHDDIVLPYYHDEIIKRLAPQGFKAVATPNGHSDLKYFATATFPGDQPVLFANADLGFEAFCFYKDYMAFVTPPDAKQYFPTTLVLPILGNTDEVLGKIGNEFGADPERLVVLKPTDTFQGKGIEILKIGALPTRLAELSKFYAEEESDSNNFWQKNIHPNVVIQSYAASQPVQAEDGRLYNGTMRVAFTALLHPETLKPEIKFHGAYWKLPVKDCTAAQSDHDPEAIISLSPDNLSRYANTAFANRPYSALVNPNDLQCVENQLLNCLNILLPAAIAKPADFSDKIFSWLNSTQSAERCMGARLATSNVFGDFLMNGADQDFKNKLSEKILRIKDEKKTCSEKRFVNLITTSPSEISTHRQYQAISTAAQWLHVYG